MFGQIGKDDHHGSVRIIHRALDAGIDLVDTAGRDDIGALLSASEAEG
jgi:aryl-alcohol dehydrogenase-like predicted oxidoreductase